MERLSAGIYFLTSKTDKIVYHPDCSQRITGGVNAVKLL
jgi:hypothetical protein